MINGLLRKEMFFRIRRGVVICDLEKYIYVMVFLIRFICFLDMLNIGRKERYLIINEVGNLRYLI